MPTIALPPTAGGDNRAPDDAARFGATAAPSLRVRIRAVAQRSALTAELAAGADPSASPELARRAAQLTSERQRKLLARALRRTIAEAHKPAILPHNVVIIRRRAVLEAEPELSALIERLRRPESVRAKGMALADRIFTDAEHSALYNPAEPGTLGRQARLAAAALEPNEGHHEFPLGV
jgi:hypothetical protein